MTTTTATTAGARAHARAQHGRLVATMRHVPARSAPSLPTDVPAAAVTWAETVGFGRYTTMALGRGTRLRLTDPDGDACVAVLLHRTGALHERLNVADTVKVPWQAYLTAGHPLLSDAGRLLATIVADTSGHHDALTGTTPAGRELLTLGVGKHGLGPRDVPPSISFFEGVRVEPGGGLTFLGSAGPGTLVELLVQTDLVVTLANTAHPLDPRPDFTGTPVEIVAWYAPTDLDALAASDLGPEHRRALENTEHDLLARSPAMSAPTDSVPAPRTHRTGEVALVPGVVIADEIVAARAPWSAVVVAGDVLTIVDLHGNQAVDCLLYAAADTSVRYSAAETIRRQRSIVLTAGTVLRADTGAALMTIIADEVGVHDTIGGACSQESNTLRYGQHTREQHACVENFLLEGARWGLGKRDLVSNINWFMNVPVDPDGALGIVDGLSAPGKRVALRAAMDVLVLVSNCPQVNNPCNGFDPTPVRMVVTRPDSTR